MKMQINLWKLKITEVLENKCIEYFSVASMAVGLLGIVVGACMDRLGYHLSGLYLIISLCVIVFPVIVYVGLISNSWV